MLSMKRFTQYIILVLFLCLSTSSFAQVGTYEVVNTPPEDFVAINADGTYNIPPLIVGEATVKLKSSGKAMLIQNDHTGRFVFKGTWTVARDVITLNIQGETDTGTVEYVLLEYVSGVYLKEVKSGMYYKRE